MKRLFLLSILSLLLAAGLRAQTGDSIRFSLLTCDPGEEIYSLFGHTAIRYERPGQGIDRVYNYGLFSFGAPNFVLRFALGETDYQLGVTSFDRFAAEYANLGRNVRQQVLNFTPAEKERLAELLEENYRPENRVYRYNFFYDNCATRPRDRIEEALQGRLRYAEEPESRADGKSFRDLIHQYTPGHSWSRLGIDLCLGSKADKPVTRRQMMFIPFYLEDFFATAEVEGEGGTRQPLVAETSVVVDVEAEKPETEGVTPLQAALLLLALVSGATIYGLRRRRPLWGIDLALFIPAGLAGCILAFLVLFSQHPAVSPNYLLWVFHPLHLCCLPWVLWRVAKRKRSRYMVANAAVLTFFLLFYPLIPQHFDLTVVPLALCLLIRSASNLILTYHPKA